MAKALVFGGGEGDFLTKMLGGAPPKQKHGRCYEKKDAKRTMLKIYQTNHLFVALKDYQASKKGRIETMGIVRLL